MKATTLVSPRRRSGAKTLFRTGIRNVPRGTACPGRCWWLIDLCGFLTDKASAVADHTVGWSVRQARRAARLAPVSAPTAMRSLRSCSTGRRRPRLRYSCEPSGEGDVVHCRRGVWHGFHNTSSDDVALRTATASVGAPSRRTPRRERGRLIEVDRGGGRRGAGYAGMFRHRRRLPGAERCPFGSLAARTREKFMDICGLKMDTLIPEVNVAEMWSIHWRFFPMMRHW